ncbi:hypothetical protein [Chitinophaga eiseniae]|nr:hypothetical protein [Chitinophaga eiseniae]
MASIEVNGEMIPVCYATDCQISQTFDTREISGPQSRWRDYIPDYMGYTIDMPVLLVYTEAYNFLDFQKAGQSGTRLKWAASAFENGGIVHSGEILLTSLNLTSQMRDVVKFDVSAIGCGELKTEAKPIQKVVYLSDFSKKMLVGCPNPYPLSVFWYDFTLIGPATNPDDVIQIFNDYSANHGNYYRLISSVDGGCYFNMEIEYNAPQPFPITVFAQQGASFAISSDQTLDNVISMDQDMDNVLTPIA